MVYLGSFTEVTSGVLANLATEFIGILLTVLIIDWMYERRSDANERRSIAHATLLELDHAVWVWQGDQRGFDLDELFSRTTFAEVEDPLPSYTQNLFMRLGTRCHGQLKLKASVVAGDPQLAFALSSLARLEAIRDIDRDYEFEEFKDILLKSVISLALVCDLPSPQVIDLRPTAHRITSDEHQHFRHFGRQVDGTHQPVWRE